MAKSVDPQKSSLIRIYTDCSGISVPILGILNIDRNNARPLGKVTPRQPTHLTKKTQLKSTGGNMVHRKK